MEKGVLDLDIAVASADGIKWQVLWIDKANLVDSVNNLVNSLQILLPNTIFFLSFFTTEHML